MSLYYRTVGLGANTIINLPINNKGLIPDDIAAAAKAMGEEVEKRFSTPIAESKRLQSGDIIELSWKNPAEINTIMIMENIENGQKIAKYTLEAFVDGKWHELVPANNFKVGKPYNANPKFETIGHKKIDIVEPVVTNKIRFRGIKTVVGKPEIRNIKVFYCAPIDQKTI